MPFPYKFPFELGEVEEKESKGGGTGGQMETFEEIVNEVLNYGFNDGPQVNRKRVEQWVNEGERLIAREVEAAEFQEVAQLQVEQGVFTYVLPENFLRMQAIYYPELVARLKPIDIQWYNQTAPAKFEGPPEMYTIYKGELKVFPTPNNSTDILELEYIKKGPLLRNPTDTPLLDRDYLHLLVDYAVERAFKAEDDIESATAWRTRWKEDLDAYATDKQWQVVDRPRVLDGSWTGSGYGGRVI